MTPHPDDTIVALSSAAGPGLRAIVRVTGPQTQAVLKGLFIPTDANATPSHKSLIPGSIRLPDVHSPLPADLYFWAAPQTYTGQDLAELHTISSPPLVERLIAAILHAGARTAMPGEFTQRAFLSGKKDLTQAEAVLAVIEAGTDADLQQALTQLAGGVTQPMQQLRHDLLNLLADVEAGLDFVDEDIEFVTSTQIMMRVTSAIAHLMNLRRQLDDRTVSGRSIRVALVGQPNAGKSSVFNKLAGREAALVSEQAGTTRDYLLHPMTLGGVAVELIDTAGWQHATNTIEEQAQRLGQEQSTRADVIVWCVPAGQPFDELDHQRLKRTGSRVLPVATKSDLHPTPQAVVTCTVMTPHGLEAFRVSLTELVTLVAKPPLAPSQSRCRAHVDTAIQALRRAHEHAREEDPQELLALALREALEQIGEMAGAIYTNDLLDRIFSRFCIGK